MEQALPRGIAVADTTGGDTTHTNSWTYNTNGQLASATSLRTAFIIIPVLTVLITALMVTTASFTTTSRHTQQGTPDTGPHSTQNDSASTYR